MNAAVRSAADDESELRSLIDTLHRAGRRIEELTGGEVDSVADHEGRSFLLRDAQQALRDNAAAKEAGILDALPANIALLDPRGTILSVNKAWEHFGWSNGMPLIAEPAPVNYLAVCDAVEGDDAAQAKSAADGIRSIIEGRAATFMLEYPCHSPEKKRWFRMTVTPVARDLRLGAVVMHIDISDQRATEQQLVEASRRAGMAEVATDVLHNVGNVLNSINVSAELAIESVRRSRMSRLADVVALLRGDGRDLPDFVAGDARGPHVVDFLATIADAWAAERQMLVIELESLRGNVDHIKQIVAMQQDHAGAAMASEPVDIADLIDDALRSQQALLDGSGVTVVRKMDSFPAVTLVKHKLLQILINLLRNAAIACGDSDRVDRILSVRAWLSGNRVVISVRDNGTGIAPEHMNSIFAHGFTTRKDGHGFGLHSAALFAAELGGTLAADSDGAGMGATFTLDLPVARHDAATG